MKVVFIVGIVNMRDDTAKDETTAFRVTEQYTYWLGYLHFTSRYGFPKLNATHII